jgi:hypothetical protein
VKDARGGKVLRVVACKDSGQRGLPYRLVFLAALVGVVGSALAFVACGPQTEAAPGQYYPVIVTPTNDSTPTPDALSYVVGAWPSDAAPPPSGTVIIYVEFHDGQVPVPGAEATIDVFLPSGVWGYGPALTNSSGLARFLVRYSAFVGRAILVEAHVSYQGQTYDASTSFAPAP